MDAQQIPATMDLLPDVGAGSEAFAINAKGEIVGKFYTRFTDGSQSYIDGSQAALWREGRLIKLGTLGGKSANAYDINDNGQIVGSSTLLGDTQTQAFLWENGKMTALACLEGASNCEARAMNNAGQIVGISYFGIGIPEEATLWEDRVPRSLTPHDNWGSRAVAINNAGLIGGLTFPSPGSSVVVTTWSHGTMRVYTEFGASDLLGINDSGDMLVDVVRHSSGHVYLVRDERVIDLADFYDQPFYPNAIADNGRIGGNFLYMSSTQVLTQELAIIDHPLIYRLPEYPSPYRSGQVMGLNNYGQMAGTISTERGPRAVMWNFYLPANSISSPTRYRVWLPTVVR